MDFWIGMEGYTIVEKRVNGSFFYWFVGLY